jgi:hypothetical protein
MEFEAPSVWPIASKHTFTLHNLAALGLERLAAILGDLAEVDAETPTGTRRRLGQGLEKPLAIWLGTESSNPAPSRGGSAGPSVPPGLRDCRRGLIHRAARPAYLVSPDCRCSGALRCAVVAGFIRSFPIRQRPFGPYLSCPRLRLHGAGE